MEKAKTTSKSKGRKVGYVRVSDNDQTEALQIDALKLAGCDVIYGDHGVSGVKTKRRGLDDVLKALVTRSLSGNWIVLDGPRCICFCCSKSFTRRESGFKQ